MRKIENGNGVTFAMLIMVVLTILLAMFLAFGCESITAEQKQRIAEDRTSRLFYRNIDASVANPALAKEVAKEYGQR